MKNFVLSSLILFVLTSCSVNNYHYFQQQNNIQSKDSLGCILCNDSSSTVYQAGIKIYGKYYSGLFVFKKMSVDTERIAFINEMGIVFFNLEFASDTFKVLQAIPQFNRKSIFQILKQDFSMILLKNLTSNYLAFDNPKENEKMYKYKDGNTTINYIINKSNNKILSIERTGKCFKKVIISIENDTSLSPKRIIIHHKNVNLKIDLKRLEKL